MKLRNKFMNNMLKVKKEKPRLFTFVLLVIGMNTTVLGLRLMHAHREKKDIVNLSEDFTNILGV